MDRILRTFSKYTGAPVQIDEKVYLSESATGHRNRAIAHLLLGHGILDRSPDEVLDLYFRQCSILVTARDLALAGACLANSGVNPVTGVTALKGEYVEKVLSVMSTCGMYDYSGAWIFNVGMPAKSGVGGGIMAVLPGQLGLGVFSPPLDEKGNSVRGIEACKRVSRDFRLHLFNVARSTSASVVRAAYDCSRFRSRRRRSLGETEILAERGRRIRVYLLQGELMFGATESVTQQMLRHLCDIDFLIIDLKRVVGLDNAATALFARTVASLAAQGKKVFFTDTRGHYRFRKYVEKSTAGVQEPTVFAFENTDRAVQWCEDTLLKEQNGTEAWDPAGMQDISTQYLCKGMTATELSVLREGGRLIHFHTGQHICRVGEEAESLFFVLSGEVEVLVPTDSHRSVRVTTVGPGMCFGEVAILNSHRRTADIVASNDTQCLEIPFSLLQGEVKTKLLINLAGYLARKIAVDTELIQQIG